MADGSFVKPLDGALIERLAAEHDLLVTIEDNVLPGGFGSAVLEHVEDTLPGGVRPGAWAFGSASRIATSPTASPRSSTRRWASPARQSPSGSSRRSAPANRSRLDPGAGRDIRPGSPIKVAPGGGNRPADRTGDLVRSDRDGGRGLPRRRSAIFASMSFSMLSPPVHAQGPRLLPGGGGDPDAPMMATFAAVSFSSPAGA